MPRYYHLYTSHGRIDIRELTPREYLSFSARNYLLAIAHEDGTFNLVKGRNIITLSQEHMEKLLQLTKPKEAQAQA